MADTHRRVSGVVDDLLLGFIECRSEQIVVSISMREFMEIGKVLELN